MFRLKAHKIHQKTIRCVKLFFVELDLLFLLLTTYDFQQSTKKTQILIQYI